MPKQIRPTVFIVDDDQDMRRFLENRLKSLNINVEPFATPEDFLNRLKQKLPDLCLIDVNIGRSRSGFLVVQAVRKVLGPMLPLLLISSTRDRDSVAHALELGATDYIAKPIDVEALAGKLSQYLDTDDVQAGRIKYVTPAGAGPQAFVDLELEISGVDEMGLRLLGPHLLSKGSHLTLSNAKLSPIVGTTSVHVRVDSTWINEDQSFGAYVEFDHENEELLRKVRLWLSNQVKN